MKKIAYVGFKPPLGTTTLTRLIMDENRITITGEFQKEDGTDFTKSERENIAMDLASFAEERGFVFIGMTK